MKDISDNSITLSDRRSTDLNSSQVHNKLNKMITTQQISSKFSFNNLHEQIQKNKKDEDIDFKGKSATAREKSTQNSIEQVQKHTKNPIQKIYNMQ